MIVALVTIIAGFLGAAGFFIARKPNAKELIDKITPYQGWIGIVLFLWGIWQTISVVLNIGWISTNLLSWIIWVTIALSNLFLGFLLGFGLISKFALSKNEEAMAKGQAIREKLMKFQVPIGFISIGLGLLYLLWALGFYWFGYIGFGVIIIAYIVLILVMPKAKPTADSSNTTNPQKGATTETKQAASTTAQKSTTASVSGTPYYEVRLTNVTCIPVGATFKVGLTVIAKKFVTDSKTGKLKEDVINDEIQIGMVKNGKEIYLKSYKFTKAETSLSLTLDQKPDKIGIDPYNKLPEKA